MGWACIDGSGEGRISDDGLFYGLAAGTVTVTAKALDGSGQSDTVTINVQEIPAGEEQDHATLTVSSAYAAAGGKAKVSVSVSENSQAGMIQFALLYDSRMLTLTDYEPGSVMKGRAPTLSNPSEGVVMFAWDSVQPLTEGGSLLDLGFKVREDAYGMALVEILTDSSTYSFVFERSGGTSGINVTPINGILDLVTLFLGDLDGNEKINIIDANMIRRHTAMLDELNEIQLLSADVNGDCKVNVIDANMVRRYIAHLIDVFPAKSVSTVA